MKRGVLLVLTPLLLTGLLLTGCLKKAEDQVPDEAIDAIANTVEDELNGPVTSVMALLRNASDSHRVNWSELNVGFDGRQIPVNWWLYRKGYVELSGSNQVGGGAYVLSRKTTELLTQPDADWFEVEPGEPTRVDCTGPTARAAGGCEVDMPFVAKLTPAGQASGAAKPAGFAVQAVVVLNENSEWQVASMTLTGTQSVHNIALDAILGPEDSRPAALDAANKELLNQNQPMEPAPLSDGQVPLAPAEEPAVIPAAPPVPDYAAGRPVTR